MKISIIIPTRNEERNISRCLSAIRRSTYKDVEIVVVDQASTDRTVELANELGAKVISVPKSDKYIPPSNSRNIGFEDSIGDIIYHVDADMEVTPNLLSECVDIFANNQIVAIVVPENDIPLNFWAKGKAFERRLYWNTEMEAARISRRNIFEKFKYDQKIFSGEDWNIDRLFRENGKISRSRNVVNHHIGRISISKEFKKKLHYGGGASVYVSQNKDSILSKLLKLIKIYFIGFLKGIFSDPIACTAFVLIRIVDIVGLCIGYLQQLIKDEKHS